MNILIPQRPQSCLIFSSLSSFYEPNMFNWLCYMSQQFSLNVPFITQLFIEHQLCTRNLHPSWNNIAYKHVYILKIERGHESSKQTLHPLFLLAPGISTCVLWILAFFPAPSSNSTILNSATTAAPGAAPLHLHHPACCFLLSPLPQGSITTL